MARYELSAGTSNKFWEAHREGSEVIVTYGRIGTVGVSSRKGYPSEEAAEKKMQSQIRSKERKGYSLVAEAELEAEEQETEARLVDADRLMGLGDPRGRLIQIQHGIENSSGTDRAKLRKEEKALLEAHAEALWGPLASVAGRACTQVEWKQGYWERVTVASSYEHQEFDTSELTAALLAHGSAQHLDHLKLGIPSTVWDGGTNWQPYLDALAKVGSASLTSLEVADDDDNAEISWCEIGDLGGVWAVCPSLETVRIRGVGIGLGTIVAAKLRSLTLESGGLPAEPVRALGAATLPSLETLEIWLGTEDYGATTTVADCAGILSGTGLPALRSLGLMNGEIMDELAEALVTAPVVAQLKTLDLSMGTMQAPGAKALREGAGSFSHLERLDVTDNFLPSAAVTELMKVLPNASAYGQKEPDAYGEEVYFFTTVAE